LLTNRSYNVSFPIYKGAKFDASITNLTYHIPPPSSHKGHEPVQITLSFLSPITPTSTLRQAVPAAYLYVHVEGSFDVSVYVDLNGQWVSGDRGSRIEWEYFQGDSEGENSMKTWRVRKQQEALFTEWADRAEWGALYFSGPSVGQTNDLRSVRC
jgi:hypothetical protein